MLNIRGISGGMLAFCVLVEEIPGDIPIAAIEEKIKTQAKIMKAPMTKQWPRYTKHALTKLLAENKCHSSTDNGKTVVVSALGRDKYVYFFLY